MSPDHRTTTGAWTLITDAVRAKRAAKEFSENDPSRPQYGRREYDKPIWFVVAYHLLVKPLGLALWLLILIGGLSLAKACGVAIPKVFLP